MVLNTKLAQFSKHSEKLIPFALQDYDKIDQKRLINNRLMNFLSLNL